MIWLVARNDLRREWRDPSWLGAAALLALGTVVALRVALAGTSSPSSLVASGALWVGLVFGNLLVVGRPIMEEHTAGTLELLTSSPASRTAVCIGKVVGALATGYVVQLLVLLVFFVGFREPADAAAATALALAMIPSSLAVAVSGILVGLLTARAHARGPLAATLMLPLTIPIVISGVLVALPAFGGASGRPLAGSLFLLGYSMLVGLILAALADEMLVE